MPTSLDATTCGAILGSSAPLGATAGACLAVQLELCIPASGRPPGQRRGCGHSGAAFAAGGKQGGSFQPTSEAAASTTGQVFGRRGVLLGAARCDCHAAPAERRSQRARVRIAHRFTVKPGKSPLGLKATACTSSRGTGATQRAATDFGTCPSGAKPEHPCPVERDHPCCPQGCAQAEWEAHI